MRSTTKLFFKQYKQETYLKINNNKLRRNLTNIRISTHNLATDRLRNFLINWLERICKLCDTGEVGTELYYTMICKNVKIVEFREQLENWIHTNIAQWHNLTSQTTFEYLVVCKDDSCTLNVVIFLDTIFNTVKNRE